MLSRRLPAGFVNAVLDDQPMDFCHDGCSHAAKYPPRQIGLYSRKLFEAFRILAISVCEQSPRDNHESREQGPRRGASRVHRYPVDKSLRCAGRLDNTLAVRPISEAPPERDAYSILVPIGTGANRWLLVSATAGVGILH